MATTEQTVTFEIQTCIYQNCGFTFAMPKEFTSRLRRDGGGYVCPVCKGWQGWKKPGTSELDKAKAELATAQHLRKLAEETARRARQDAEHFERSRNAYKGKVTNLRNRAAAGICPCCNKHFAVLHKHMQAKHPEFVGEDVQL